MIDEKRERLDGDGDPSTSEITDRQYIELLGQELDHERERVDELEDRVDELEAVVDELSDEILVKLDQIKTNTSVLVDVQTHAGIRDEGEADDDG